MSDEVPETLVVADSVEAWRDWLAGHSTTEAEAWLVIPHVRSGVPGPRYHEAVEQALCFGWIDGTNRKHDPTSSRQRFTPRKRRSNWSDSNRERVARLIEQDQMTDGGWAALDLARETGTWPEAPQRP